MKNLLLMLLLSIVAFNATAKFRTFTSAGVSVLGQPDCKVYHVSIWQDYGSDDPRQWTKVAEKHLWSDGCDFGTEEPDLPNDDFPASDNQAIITDVAEDSGCTLFEVEITDPDGVLLASGHLNSCQDNQSFKRTLELINEKAEGIAIFPTKVDHHVEIGGLPANKNINMEIIDLSGKVIYQLSNLNEDEKIHLDFLNSGFYFIKISNDYSILLNQKFFKL